MCCVVLPNQGLQFIYVSVIFTNNTGDRMPPKREFFIESERAIPLQHYVHIEQVKTHLKGSDFEK